MHRFSLVSVFFSIFMLLQFEVPLQAQNFKVTDYQYELNNGINVHTVEGWDFVYVWPNKVIKDSALAAGQGKISFAVLAQGDLIAPGTKIELSDGKSSYALVPGQEIRIAAGRYLAKIQSPLQDGAGKLSFTVNNIPLQAQTVSKITVLLNDVQVLISASKDNIDGMAIYEFKGEMSKKDQRQAGYTEIAGLFTDFKSKKRLEPAEGIWDNKAKIKPGIFALKLEIMPSWADKKIEVWLDNFKFEANTYYKIMINANGSYLECIRENNPNLMQFYPVGSAKKLGLHENKKLELFSFENLGKGRVSPCPIGSYDILLNYGYGERYEWVENVRFEYGQLTRVQ